MARIKYYYDTESCRYERIRVTRWDIFWNAMGFISLSLVLAGIIVFILSFIYNSPKEVLLTRQLEELETHYGLLSQEMDETQAMLDVLQERDDNLYRVTFGAEAIPENVRKAGVGGVDRYKELSGLSEEDLLRESYERIDRLKRQMYIQTKSYDDIVDLAKRKEEMLASMPAIQPVSAKQLKWLTSGFGYRIDPIFRTPRFHPGVDYAMPPGSPVYATGDGVVKRVESKFSGYGKQIEIDHGFGYLTKYAHLNGFEVREGQKIKRGELIGYSGNTGKSTGPHLHYEVMLNGNKMNPVHYMYKDISPEEYEEILRLAASESIPSDSY